MAQPWESSLERWQDAGLIEPALAARIREFECSRNEQSLRGFRWPVLLALAFGGFLLGAGFLLFVSAHWEELSPAQRFTLVLAMVGGFHLAGALVAERWPALAICLHTVGTFALGAGIALAGQIFNLEEHWPAAVLMWAVGAAAAWALLRHWTQALFTALLIPFWLAGEWEVAGRNERFIPVALLALAFTYFSAASPRRTPERVALAWAGGLAVLPFAVIAAVAGAHSESGSNDWLLLLAACGASLALAWWLRREEAWTNVLATLWVLVLATMSAGRMEIALYTWGAIGAIGLVAWGLHDRRTERVNLGVAGFALDVLIFYFSTVMDKLGRSLSLIVLGLLFLGGGWLLERTRRQLVARAKEFAA